MMIFKIEVGLFGVLIILWKYHSWTESIHMGQEKKEKGRKNIKQGNICASYQAAEMAFLIIMSTNFSSDISGVLGDLISV